MKNLALSTDSYKASHFLQFPRDVRYAFYYMSARVSDPVKVYGLQAIIKKHLMKVPTLSEIRTAALFWKKHGLPFNEEGWKLINGIGYLPIEIKAIPEGTVTPGGLPVVTVQNTIEGFHWIPGWIETLLMQMWYPTTVCTRSWQCKNVISAFLDKTGTPELIDFKLHDFGYRGATCDEAAGIGASAHLVNFKGTDTVAGVLEAMQYYGADVCGFSIPAAEHSTMTSWGQENEEAAYDNMLEQFAENGSILAVVSDSYDLDNAITNMWCGSLKEKVLSSGATVVIRPDSGDPATVVLRVLQQLEAGFGTTVNPKGYKVLPSCVRIIQGDGLDDAEDIKQILELTEKFKYSADNVAFGMGGGLLQKLNRDSLRFAMKCSAVADDKKVWKGVAKCPKDAPWKASMKGCLDITPAFEIRDSRAYNGPSALQTVFKNGELLIDEAFDTVRNR